MEMLMTIWELERLTNIKVPTLRKMVLKKRVPFVKIGRPVQFRPCDIEEWITKASVVVPVDTGVMCNIENANNAELDF